MMPINVKDKNLLDSDAVSHLMLAVRLLEESIVCVVVRAVVILLSHSMTSDCNAQEETKHMG